MSSYFQIFGDQTSQLGNLLPTMLRLTWLHGRTLDNGKHILPLSNPTYSRLTSRFQSGAYTLTSVGGEDISRLRQPANGSISFSAK